MKRAIKYLSPLAAALAVFAYTSTATATMLTGGTSTSSFAESLDPGATLYNSQTAGGSFSLSDGTAGTVNEWVVSGNQSNPSLLSFIFQVNVTAGTPGASINRLTFNNLLGFSVDVGQTSGPSAALAGSTTGTIQSSLADLSLNGNVVGFDFTPGTLVSGTSSYLLIVNTNATTDDFLGNFSVQDGGSQNFVAYEPAGTPFVSTPEPASSALLASCFVSMGGFGVLRHWRKRIA